MSDSAKFCTVCGHTSSLVVLPEPPGATSAPPPLTGDNVDPLALWMFIGSIFVGWNPVLWVGTLIGSIIALQRTSLPRVRGRRLAIAALVIHAVYLLIFIALVFIIVSLIFSLSRHTRLAS
jgi:hypothetical protein